MVQRKRTGSEGTTTPRPEMESHHKIHFKPASPPPTLSGTLASAMEVRPPRPTRPAFHFGGKGMPKRNFVSENIVRRLNLVRDDVKNINATEVSLGLVEELMQKHLGGNAEHELAWIAESMTSDEGNVDVLKLNEYIGHISDIRSEVFPFQLSHSASIQPSSPIYQRRDDSRFSIEKLLTL